jgi:hypothetical protein
MTRDLSQKTIRRLRRDLIQAHNIVTSQAECLSALRKELAELRVAISLINRFEFRRSAGRSSKHRR